MGDTKVEEGSGKKMRDMLILGGEGRRWEGGMCEPEAGREALIGGDGEESRSVTRG
jgi:hypothetical protein